MTVRAQRDHDSGRHESDTKPESLHCSIVNTNSDDPLYLG